MANSMLSISLMWRTTHLLGEEGKWVELQITYRIADRHSRSGELGVTTLVEDEKS
jgi:hypothetical protein